MVSALQELEDIRTSSSFNEESSSSAELHLVQLGPHALTNISSTSLPWVIDSGATEHITGMKHLFYSYSEPKSIVSTRINGWILSSRLRLGPNLRYFYHLITFYFACCRNVC